MVQQGQIRIVGARQHNLKDLSLTLPRRAITAFTGVSGSGKTSLVFDTIAAEAQRQLNETFTAFVRNRLPSYGRPDVDVIEDLSPVVVIDQRRLGGNARSTVGTITDIYALLRLLFSRAGDPQLGESNRFSFNDPAGMCPRCSGIGSVVTPDTDTFLDLDRSLEDGAILLPGFGNGQYWYRQYADIGAFDPTTPLRAWSPDEREALIHGGEAAARLGRRAPKDYQGLLERFTRIYIHTEGEMSERKQAVVERSPPRWSARTAAGSASTPRRAPSRWPGTRSPGARRWRSPTWSAASAASTTPPRPRPWRPSSSGWRRWPASGWATSVSVAPPRRCPAASRSGSRWCAISAAA